MMRDCWKRCQECYTTVLLIRKAVGGDVLYKVESEDVEAGCHYRGAGKEYP